MKKLRDLRVGQKLILLAIVFLAPTLAVITALFVLVDRISIDFARDELDGVRVIRPMIDVVRVLQQRRALGQAELRNSGLPVAELYQQKHADLLQFGKEVRQAAQASAPRLLDGVSSASGDSWEAIEKAISQLPSSPPENADPVQMLRQDSQLIRRVLDFMAEVADRSKLTLDPDLESYYLQEMLIRSAPEVVEHLSAARAMSAGILWPGRDEAATRREMSEMLTLTRERQRRVVDSFSRAGGAHAAIRESLGPGFLAVEERGRQGRVQMEAVLSGDPAATATAKAEFLSAATDRLDGVYTMKTPLADALQEVLKARISMRVQQLTRAGVGALVGMVILTALSIGIIRNIRKPIAQLAATARAIAEGQSNAKVTLAPRGDEIGDLAEALQHMLEEEHRVREQLVENNVRLLEATERALDADRAKRDFLASMSHEIRTPLNGILPVTDLLADTTLDGMQQEYLRTIRTSAEHLLTLVDDVLDFSKIEAGRVVIEHTRFELRELLGDTVQTLAARAADRGLELTLQVRPDVPDDLVGDPHRLRQVVMNLVGNSLKFTHEGEVSVLVERVSASDDAVELRFQVRDTGIGISEEVLPRLFAAFEQADKSTTRQYGGSGLGLAICKRLVEMMGGGIAVESVAGEGSAFTFTVRFAPAGASDAATGWSDLPSARVLSVDDNATNRMIVRELLSTWGLHTDEAKRAEDALAMMREAHAAGTPYDLVVTDMMMPDLDGYGLVERIRADADLSGARVVMLTSATRAEDATRSRQLGISSVILKPVRQAVLMDAIAEAFGARRRSRTSIVIDPSRIPAQRSLRILLAEDNATNQRVARVNLESWGHTVVVAADGAEAVERFEKEPFDLILMDTQMPRMNGLEATRAIRRREAEGARVPIIAMTANVMKGFREECLAEGMDGYVTKPLRREILVQEMANVIPDLIGSAAAAPSVPMPSPMVPSGTEDLAFDADAFLAMLGGSRDTLKEIIGITLRDDVPRLTQELGAAASTNDSDALRDVAHAIKGLAAELRAEPCRAAAMNLESSKAVSDAAILDREFQRLSEALTKCVAE